MKSSKVTSLFVYLIILMLHQIQVTNTITYDRYQLAIDLYRSGFKNIDEWVCIVGKISEYDTTRTWGKSPSGTYGLFQIYEPFWCKHGEPGNRCNMDCRNFLDDNIMDDIECAKKIYEVEGFSAWDKNAKECFPNNTYLYSDCVQNF